jgi:hypothetical protein
MNGMAEEQADFAQQMSEVIMGRIATRKAADVSDAEGLPTWWVDGLDARAMQKAFSGTGPSQNLTPTPAIDNPRTSSIYYSMKAVLTQLNLVGPAVLKLVVTPLDAALMEGAYLANVPSDYRTEDKEWKSIVRGEKGFMDSNEPNDLAERFLAMMNLYIYSKWYYTHPICRDWAADVGALFALRNILEVVKAEAANARRGEKSVVASRLDVLLTDDCYEAVREAIALAEKTPYGLGKPPKKVLSPYGSADAKFYAHPVIRDHVDHSIIPRAIGNDPVVGLAPTGNLVTQQQQKQQQQQQQPHDTAATAALHSAARNDGDGVLAVPGKRADVN